MESRSLRKHFAGWPASVKWRAYASHLGFGTGDGFFEMPSELARDQEAHSAAQSFGFYMAESRFEAALCVLPEHLRFSESSAPGRRESDHPIAPVLAVDSNRDQPVSLQRLQCVRKRPRVHYQRLGQTANCRRFASTDLRQDCSLGS